MVSAQLFLKNNSSVTIENLSSIEVNTPRNDFDHDDDDFEMLQVNPKYSYIFLGDKESVSVFGADLLYVRFVRA